MQSFFAFPASFKILNQLAPQVPYGYEYIYITNTVLEEVPTNYVHSLYSLRWQIEILFKTWKSFFEIDECKNIKRERLECHLYGQLIGILLRSSTMFQMRQFLLEKTKQELSEYKAIYMIKDYFPLLFQAIATGTEELLKFCIVFICCLKRTVINVIRIRACL